MSGSLYFGLTEHMWLIASFTSSMFAKPVDKIIGLLRLLNFVKSGFFDYWLKSKKKLGGQHKIPRLSNQRNYIEEMKKHITRFL